LSNNNANTNISHIPSQHRTKLIITIFFIWNIIIIAQISRFMIFEKEEILKKTYQNCVIIKEIPEIRGTIFLKKQIPLAWSNRFYILTWTVPENSSELEIALEKLPKEILQIPLKAIRDASGLTITLNNNLTPEQLIQAHALETTIKDLHIQSTFKRSTIKNPPPNLNIGKVKLENGTEIGISGLELKYNNKLQSRPRIYQIMQDKNGNLIKESFKLITSPRPGYDVYLNDDNQ